METQFNPEYLQLEPESEFARSGGGAADFVDEDGVELRELGPISRLNLIVGSNNAGKSRLMRAIAKMVTLVLHNQPSNYSKALTALAELRSALPLEGEWQPPEPSLDWISNALRSRTSVRVADHDIDLARTLVLANRKERPEAYQELLAANLPLLAAAVATGAFQGSIDATTKATLAQFWRYVEPGPRRELQGGGGGGAVPRLYFPNYRTAWCHMSQAPTRGGNLDLSADAISEKEVRTAYSLDRGLCEVNSGARLHAAMVVARSSDNKVQRQQFEQFHEFIKRQFFPQANEFEIIPVNGRPDISVRIDGEEHTLPHLGDGVAAVMLLAFPLFTAAHGTWVFIEEPENALHPGFQRVLVEMLLTEPGIIAKEMRVFATTHSNHILGIALEHPDTTTVLRVKRSTGSPSSKVSRVAGPDMRVLDDLGVTNTSLYLAKCSIWVEGPSDRVYLRAYLDAYFEHQVAERGSSIPFENTDYAFVEYGGSLVENLDFSDTGLDAGAEETDRRIRARFVANRVLLLADQDETKDARHKRFAEWSRDHEGESQRFVYLTTGRREMENLVSCELLRRFLASRQAQDLIDCSKAVKYANYGTEGLGTYLSELSGYNAIAEGTTLARHYKNALAVYVRDALQKTPAAERWGLCSAEAQGLAQQVAKFIEHHRWG